MSTRARVAAALLVVALTAIACTDSGDAEPPARAKPRAERAARLSLLYVHGRALMRLDVASGRRERLQRLPTPDVHASPRPPWVALVDAPRPAPGDEDFTARPRLLLVDPVSGRTRRLGAGFAPLWDLRGERLAWLRPTEPRACSGEACAGDVEVVVLDVTSGRPQTWLPPGGWGLLAWAGDRLLVSDRAALARALAVGPDGAEQPVAAPPSAVWGASPDGGVLVTVTGAGIELGALGAQGAGHRLAGARGVLAEGAWAPRSERLAVVELTARRGVPSSRLLLVDPVRATARPVPGSAGATGSVLWAPDERALAFARSLGGDLEAVLCQPPRGPCRRLFGWSRGVVLLRLERVPPEASP